MVQQNQEDSQASELTKGNIGEIPEDELVKMTIPEMIERFPHTEARAFTIPKAKGCVYFLLDVVPLRLDVPDKDRIINALKFDTINLTVVKTQYPFKLEDELGAVTLEKFGEMVEGIIIKLKGRTDEFSINQRAHLAHLGFKIK